MALTMNAGGALKAPWIEAPAREGAAGVPLPDDVRRDAEQILDEDLSDVRIHVGAEPRRFKALAFTMGPHIYFTPGLYDPRTREGRTLLGHELAHVVQQRRGRASNHFGYGIAVVRDSILEEEATKIGRLLASTLPSRQPHPTAIVQAKKAPLPARRRATGSLIQRASDDKELQDAINYAREIIPYAGNIRSEIIATSGNSLLRCNGQTNTMGAIARTDDREGGWKPRLVYNSSASLKLLKYNPGPYADSAFSTMFLHNFVAHKTMGGVCDDYSAVVFCYLLDHPPAGVVSMSRCSWTGIHVGHSVVVVELEGDKAMVVDPWLTREPLDEERYTNLMKERGLGGKWGSMNQFVYTERFNRGIPVDQGYFGAWKVVAEAKQGLRAMIEQIAEFNETKPAEGGWNELGFNAQELNRQTANRIIFDF